MIKQNRLPIQLNWNFRLFVIFGAAFVILTSLILNAIWLDSLYKLGVNMIHQTQSTFQGGFFVLINNLFSMLCHPSTVGILLFIQICVVKHKFKALIHISFFLLCIYLMAVLKQIYQQSRPIWSSKQIQKLQWFCPTDFGNPSGHSFAVFPLYEPLISKYLGFENYKFAWIFLIFFGFFVPFSRTYLGVHSVNQVMFGLTLGVAATLLYRYGIRQWLYIILSKIYKLKKIKHLIIIIMIHIVCFFVPYLCYEIYSQNRPIQKNDIDNLNGFCLTGLTSLLIQQSMLVKCTFQSFIFGIMYGLYFLKLTQKDKQYFSGRWQYYNRRCAFEHLLTTIVLCGVILLVFIIGLPKLIHVTFFDYLSNTIGMILIGFCLAYVLPKIQQKFNWINFGETLIPPNLPAFEMENIKQIGQYFG